MSHPTSQGANESHRQFALLPEKSALCARVPFRLQAKPSSHREDSVFFPAADVIEWGRGTVSLGTHRAGRALNDRDMFFFDGGIDVFHEVRLYRIRRVIRKGGEPLRGGQSKRLVAH